MTDQIHSLTVVLEKDVCDDDCEDLIRTIKTLRNVLSVGSHVTNVDNHMAQERARHELGQKLWEALYPKKDALK